MALKFATPSLEGIWMAPRVKRGQAIAELGGCPAPKWVKNKAKYRDTCKHFNAQVRRAKVNPETIDFDHEIYDDTLTKGEIKQRVRSKVWGDYASGPEKSEYLASTYEDRIELPRAEYDRLLSAEGKLQYARGQADGLEIVFLKAKDCFKKALNLCRTIHSSKQKTLKDKIVQLKKECPGDYRGIIKGLKRRK